MTLRLTLGVDPGQTGCVAAIADGEPAGFIDMPTTPRKAGGHEVNGAELAERLRALLAAHPGACVAAITEQVSGRTGQGVSGVFRFGQADGVVRGVLGALRIDFAEVTPRAWKKAMGLKGADKAASRASVIERWPHLAGALRRVKDHGRAEALLIALWAEQTEQAGNRV